MREVFSGWRRKAGCVTLVMALVFMTAWIRSRVEFDDFNHDGSNVVLRLFSTAGRLGLFRYTWRTKNDFTYSFWVDSDDVPVGFSSGDMHSQIIQQWEILGFHFQTGQMTNQIQYQVYTIPYWSIVLPLTLLSAYLILWKPRQRREPEHA